MNLTCPHCRSRLRSEDTDPAVESTLTCPQCGGAIRIAPRPAGSRPLVAQRGDPGAGPADFDNRDFLDVLLSFKIRRTDGSVKSFRTLAQLEALIEEGEVLEEDELTWDRRTWTRIGEITDRRAFFVALWDRASRSEVTSLAPPDAEAVEDVDDAPTVVYDRGGNSRR